LRLTRTLHRTSRNPDPQTAVGEMLGQIAPPQGALDGRQVPPETDPNEAL